MSLSLRTRVSFAAALFFFVVSGCSGDAMAPMLATVSVTPSDGATGVRLDAPIVLAFEGAVDRGTVERSFRLLSERSMNDSLCSADSARVGDMTSMMADAAMMDHMSEVHAVSGGFQWSGDAECSFRPDTPMTPDTRHMVYLGREMMEMMGGRALMEHRGEMEADRAFHFTTTDLESHESHH